MQGNTNEYKITTYDHFYYAIEGYYGFEDTELVIPNVIDGKDIKKICAEAFKNCSGIKKLIISPGIKIIGERAFTSCTGLEEVVICEGIERIEQGAFYGCHQLNTVHFPSSLKELGTGSSSFFSNGSFEETGLREVNIPNKITYIPKKTFKNCTSLKNVQFSENLSRIYDESFSGCTNLESVTFPDKLRSIKKMPFVIAYLCQRLNSMKDC